MARGRPLVALVVALVLVGMLAVVARGAQGDATPAASPVASPGASPIATPGTPAATRVTIIIKDFAFVPANVTVKVGTTVTWVNEGPTPHTTTAYDQHGNKIWDSGILQKGQKYSLTFTKPGSYDYTCTLHPYMTAHLTVVK